MLTILNQAIETKNGVCLIKKLCVMSKRIGNVFSFMEIIFLLLLLDVFLDD